MEIKVKKINIYIVLFCTLVIIFSHAKNIVASTEKIGSNDGLVNQLIFSYDDSKNGFEISNGCIRFAKRIDISLYNEYLSKGENVVFGSLYYVGSTKSDSIENLWETDKSIIMVGSQIQPKQVDESGIESLNGKYYQYSTVFKLTDHQLSLNITTAFYYEIDGEKTFIGEETTNFASVAHKYINYYTDNPVVSGHLEILNYIVDTYRETASTTLTGKIVNLASKVVDNATVELDGQTVQTNELGEFSIKGIVSNDSEVIITKVGLQNKTIKISNYIVNDFGITDLGNIELLSQPTVITFGGNKGINLVKTEITRTKAGINLKFISDTSMPNAAHIELFIDTHESISDRDLTDYRIDFAPNKPISIVNFGDSTNTDPSSIVLNTISNDSKLHLEAFIPYSFLGIQDSSIFGISAGVWGGSDWDGWVYDNSFIAPERTNEYVRVNVDNQLYRYENNNKTIFITGELNPADDVLVNGVSFSDNYNLRVAADEPCSLTFSKVGYITQIVDLSALQTASDVKLDIQLEEISIYNLRGIVTSIYGVVDGATLSIAGKTVTTDNNGCFVIENIPGLYKVITFNKDGFETMDYCVTTSDIDNKEATINVHKPSDVYEKIGNLKNPTDLKIVRTVEGILFTFNTQNVFNAGNFEVYIDTKESEANREDSNTNYRFDLYSNGTVNVINFGGGTNTSNATIKVTKVNDYMTTMLIPYTFLGVTNTEVIGYSFGLVLNGWDGWGHNGFIAPEHPTGYIRLSADNKAYKSNSNK